ncbi:hypothetical protein VRRI112168_03545 [Vreelandella rituensis]|uniref:Type IV pilus biogenesis protein PilP n=1 Tax=Vreelandella rituensis TaxID=2282306 RepID=A0A368UB00_9GAMM|nr:hypothetical protein [Halomonas rituensis]RCV93727.1 hypothetical protein DU506_00815 [Halomonas rituensis]
MTKKNMMPMAIIGLASVVTVGGMFVFLSQQGASSNQPSTQNAAVNTPPISTTVQYEEAPEELDNPYDFEAVTAGRLDKLRTRDSELSETYEGSEDAIYTSAADDEALPENSFGQLSNFDRPAAQPPAPAPAVAVDNGSVATAPLLPEASTEEAPAMSHEPDTNGDPDTGTDADADAGAGAGADTQTVTETNVSLDPSKRNFEGNSTFGSNIPSPTAIENQTFSQHMSGDPVEPGANDDAYPGEHDADLDDAVHSLTLALLDEQLGELKAQMQDMASYMGELTLQIETLAATQKEPSIDASQLENMHSKLDTLSEQVASLAEQQQKIEQKRSETARVSARPNVEGLYQAIAIENGKAVLRGQNTGRTYRLAPGDSLAYGGTLTSIKGDSIQLKWPHQEVVLSIY